MFFILIYTPSPFSVLPYYFFDISVFLYLCIVFVTHPFKYEQIANYKGRVAGAPLPFVGSERY